MADDVFGILGTTQATVFRVERVVAEGGFAVVYKAFHTGFRSPVALKCLKIPEAMTHEQRSAFLEKFREEGELLFRLSGLVPAVVRPLHVDVLMIDGRMVPFLALEWLEGEGLDRIIEQRRLQGKEPIDVRRAVEFLAPAAHAISQAHHLPGPDGPVTVVHRDLKPENIFVTKAQGGEVVKILDFGIARTKSAASVEQNVAKNAAQNPALDAFTPGYAAPEQWQPHRFGEAGPWTDVFGLALTMVEMITGVVAIDGDLAQMMNMALDAGKRPTPRTLGMSVPDSVERAFARALAVDPRERSRSIEDFWSELEVALGFPPSIRTSLSPVADRVRRFTSEPPPVSQPISSPRGYMPTVPPAPLLPKIEGESIRPPSSLRRPTSSPVPPPATGPAPAFELAEEPRSLPPPRATRSGPPSSQSGAPSSRGAVPAPPSSAPGSAPITMRAPVMREIKAAEPAAPTARDLLKVPVALVAMGVIIGLSDWIYTQASGELIHIGSLRPVWIAAPLAVIGVGMACWRLVGLL